MVSLQASSQFVPLSSSSSKRTRFLKDIQILFRRKPFRPQRLVKNPSFVGSLAVLPKTALLTTSLDGEEERKRSVPVERLKLYAILEEVVDRIEMHKNIGEQRNNWNTHMLNSINLITLMAALMAGFARTNGGISFLSLKISSSVLLLSAVGLVTFMNKIQPSQLAEEHRNADA